MDILRAVLPDRYSPLQANGNGIQSIYLTGVSADFDRVLAVWRHRLEEKVVTDDSLRETDREAIIRARRGQGLFKQRVMEIETGCRITGGVEPCPPLGQPLQTLARFYE